MTYEGHAIGLKTNICDTKHKNMANKHPLSIDKHTKVSSCFAICTGRQAEFSTRNKGHGSH